MHMASALAMHSNFAARCGDRVIVGEDCATVAITPEWLTGEGYKRAFLGKDAHGQSQAFLSLKINPAKDYVKVSTFFVMPQVRGNGVGKALLMWMFSYVKEHTSSNSLKVTVSEDKPESLAFFQKHGFTVVDQVVGKYVEGKTEFILKGVAK